MHSELAAYPLTYDQERPTQRICRTFRDDRNFWHMWLISDICPLRTDHTFSDWECAARFLNDAEAI
jgi:hypothetical protein